MSLPPKPKGVSVDLELITPDKAKLILARNKANRPMEEANAKFIATAMAKDKFMFTGESVIIASNNDLVDGQHRLDGIILTGKAQWLVVVRGVEPKAFLCVDLGKPRSIGDSLSVQNIIHPHSYGRIGIMLMNYKKGGIEKMASRGGMKRMGLTPNDVSDFVMSQHPSMVKSREYGFAKANTVLAGNMLSAFHYIFKKIDNDAACDFCNKLADGKDLEKNDPIAVLRRELIADIRSTRKMEDNEKMSLIVLAWNAYRKNKSVTELKWNYETDEYPKPI